MMMYKGDEHSIDDNSALAVADIERVRNYERKRDGQMDTSKSKPNIDFSDIECYYYRDKGHIQSHFH